MSALFFVSYSDMSVCTSTKSDTSTAFTTGRRRRCVGLDLVVMKHSCLINGYDSLNLDEVKITVKYLLDGKELAQLPWCALRCL